MLSQRVLGRAVARWGPTLAGGLIAFSLPPWGWWPLAFLGVALLDQSLCNARVHTANGWKLRLTQGFTFGLTWMFPATLWMWDLTPPGYIIAGLLFSAMYGVAIALVPPLSHSARRIGIISLLVLVGVVRWSWPFGGVPLATLAMTQAASPLGPLARTFGSLTLVALVGIGGTMISALYARHLRFAVGAAATILALVLLTWVAPFGNAFDTMDVAVVQGGGPQNTRAISSDDRAVFDRHVSATRTVETPVDLILWPENVVDLEGELKQNIEFEEMDALAKEMDSPIIAGITEGFRGDDPYYTNASVVINPKTDKIARYDKVRRVPYGEYVPFRSIVERASPPRFLPWRDARAGTEPAVLDTLLADARPVTLGISISWEIFFDTRARDAISNGGSVLINPTNGSSYWLTIVQSQQIASSQLRAMETGRWVLQAAPTGFSAIVTPDGDVIDRSGVSETKVIHGTVELREGLTWAVRFGRWPMVIVAALAFLVSQAWRDRGGRPRHTEADTPAATESRAA